MEASPIKRGRSPSHSPPGSAYRVAQRSQRSSCTPPQRSRWPTGRSQRWTACGLERVVFSASARTPAESRCVRVLVSVASHAPVMAARGGRARVLEVQHGRRRRRAHVRRRPVRVLRKRWQRSRRRKRGVASRLVLWQHDALSAPLRRTCPLVHVCRVGNVAMTT